MFVRVLLVGSALWTASRCPEQSGALIILGGGMAEGGGGDAGLVFMMHLIGLGGFVFALEATKKNKPAGHFRDEQNDGAISP